MRVRVCMHYVRVHARLYVRARVHQYHGGVGHGLGDVGEQRGDLLGLIGAQIGKVAHLVAELLRQRRRHRQAAHAERCNRVSVYLLIQL